MGIKSFVAVATTAIVFAVSASAAPLSGLFEIDIYNYESGGKSSNAAATVDNVAGRSGDFVGTIIYDGALFLRSDTRGGAAGGTPLITQFLDTGTGSYSVDNGDISGLFLSSGGGSGDPKFGTTTLFDIVAISLDMPYRGAFEGVIHHDDGMTLLEDGAVVAGYSKPTSERKTNYMFGGGDFRLVYTSANGDPSLLEVHASPVAPVPLPAPALMLLTACGALGWAARRRKT
ncbi:MAG: hypothetical protein AAGC86_17460 [Pseudomonadota bacterium]